MKIAKSKNNFSLFLLLLAVFISFFLRVGAVWDNNFAFTMDQGRDLVDIRVHAHVGERRAARHELRLLGLDALRLGGGGEVQPQLCSGRLFGIS